MPRVAILKIKDGVVGPHLQLLRNVCEPASTSSPHVTVRFFERLTVPKEYVAARATYIDLVEPGTFQPNSTHSNQASERSHTVFIRCKSDDLAPLEHKPHYPESDFHITVYDGESARFARQLLEELDRFSWGLRVLLPVDTSLTIKELSPQKRSRRPGHQEFRPGLQQLFFEATSENLSWSDLTTISDRKRLQLCRSILTHLFMVAGGLQRIAKDRTRKGDSGPDRDSLEPDLPEVHLTPPELAKQIAAYAVEQLGAARRAIDFGDPAVGTGAFFSALLQVVDPVDIASAIGVDINTEQVAAARWRWADKGMEVLKGDYLHMDRLPRRTLVLANPPYLRHQAIPSDYKARLLERASVKTSIRVSAQSGLYVYFLLLSHDWMQQDAIAAWLIPSEFMRAPYGLAVRRYLTETVELIRIHEFGADAPQFENVKVSPAVVVFRNRPASPGRSVTLSAGGSLNIPVVREVVTVEELRHEATWAVPLRRLRKGQPSDVRIGDLFVVRRGIATGANEFFMMTRDVAAERGIPKRALTPILPKVRALKSDVVEADADGYPRVDPQWCVIDCDLDEAEIGGRYPRFLSYLKSAKREGIMGRHLLKDRRPWYRQEHRDPAPFLCTYMGRGTAGSPPIRFIWNKSNAIATNTYLMLYPRPTLARLIDRKPKLVSALFALLQEAAGQTVSEMSRVRADGLHKIEPRELLNVRLAGIPPWLEEAVESHLPLVTADR